MDIRRIIPNISSAKMEESREFYRDFIGLRIVMDMDWVVTFASPSDPAAQLNIVRSGNVFSSNDHITITFEVADVDALYAKAKESGYEITYPLTREPWGPVKRFWIRDPNGVTLNLMAHVIE